MGENLRSEQGQDKRQPDAFGKSRGQLNQPKGKIEDLFRMSESNREPSEPSITERPPDSNSSGQVSGSRTATSSDK